jgi:hypothetical protein
LYEERSGKVYAYYEKRNNPSLNYLKITSANPTAFDLYCGIVKFESIVLTEDTVVLFDVLYTGDCYEIKELPKNIFTEQKDYFYESQGLKDNGWMTPKSELHISKNAIGFLYASKNNNLINHHLLNSELLRQLEEIYQATVNKSYEVTPQTTVKTFYKDIIEPLYPDMSESLKIIFCKIFKGEIS